MSAKIDRFIVRYMPAKRVYELRWSIYESKKSKSLTLTQQDIKSRRNFEFNFRQFDIRRLLFKVQQATQLHYLEFSSLEYAAEEPHGRPD